MFKKYYEYSISVGKLYISLKLSMISEINSYSCVVVFDSLSLNCLNKATG